MQNDWSNAFLRAKIEIKESGWQEFEVEFEGIKSLTPEFLGAFIKHILVYYI